MTAVRAIQLSQAGKSGIILCGREFMNSLDESSLAEIKAAIASEPWMRPFFEIGEKYIRTVDRRIEYKFAGLRHNLDSIKSKARIHLMWIDEAEPVSDTAWTKIIPTVREEDSELWITWNPESKRSATHLRFREDPPESSKIVQVNYQDNPWFPDVLEMERLNDLNKRPEKYAHIWLGDFITAVEGAYYAAGLLEAGQEKRIGRVAKDPLMQIRAFWDIGGTGAKSDATAIWIAQFVGKEIRVLNYYEAQGQPLASHINWLRTNGYKDALCVLPHDGATNDRVHDVSFESAIEQAGFEVEVIPNQGKGAASKRIEEARRLFPRMWFNESTTEPGRDALAWYHEKMDEDRSIGLGPLHDWASHGADAFGLMAVAYEEPTSTAMPDIENDWVV